MSPRLLFAAQVVATLVVGLAIAGLFASAWERTPAPGITTAVTR